MSYRPALPPHLGRRPAQPGRAQRLPRPGRLRRASPREDPPYPRPWSLPGNGRL